MKLKKIDLSGIKDFLFQKGERVGLAICALVAVVFLVIGIMKAGGSTTYAKDLADARLKKDRQINSFQKGEEDKDGKPAPVKADPDPWPIVKPAFDQTQLSLAPDAQDTKRLNPSIVKILYDEKHVQVDYLRGGY